MPIRRIPCAGRRLAWVTLTVALGTAPFKAVAEPGLLDPTPVPRTVLAGIEEISGDLKSIAGRPFFIQEVHADSTPAATGHESLTQAFMEEAKRAGLKVVDTKTPDAVTVQLATTFYVWTTKFEAKHVSVAELLGNPGMRVDDEGGSGATRATIGLDVKPSKAVAGLASAAFRLLDPFHTVLLIADSVRPTFSRGNVMPIFEEGRQDMDTEVRITIGDEEPRTLTLSTQFPGDAAPYRIGRMLQMNTVSVVRFLTDAQRGTRIEEANGALPAASRYAPTQKSGEALVGGIDR